ncbi:MAG TPA: hypothetical protein VF665_07205 [Longimicrobium sp.]|jgi:hypothetical protein|uniref:hypothetical protein n=1 Tax=Longimicrobium sp. TaxID=2029185 RepID=UPI002EDA099B
MSHTPGQTVLVRLVFADQGTFHAETVNVPMDLLGRYERLVDLLREEESVTRQLFVDMGRLVSAAVVEAGS